MGTSLAAVILAGISSYAAVRSVKISQDAERRQLRAYVEVYPIEKANGQVVNRENFSLTLHQRVQNFGQTPAYESVTNFRISYFNGFKETDLGEGSSPKQPALPPQREMWLALHLNALPRDIEERWLDGQGWIQWVGDVRYKDIFGHEHSAPFCTQFQFGEERPYASTFDCPVSSART